MNIWVRQMSVFGFRDCRVDWVSPVARDVQDIVWGSDIVDSGEEWQEFRRLGGWEDVFIKDIIVGIIICVIIPILILIFRGTSPISMQAAIRYGW